MARRGRIEAPARIGGHRGTAVVAIAGVHGLLLLALLSQVQHAQPVVVPAMALLAFPDPPATRVPVAVPVPPLVTEVEAPQAVEVIADEPVPSPDSDLAAALSGDCAPEAALQSALSAAPDVQLALARVPASNRSVADAVIIWNATWAELARRHDAPLASVRAVVTRTLRGLPDVCLAAPVTGPRLFLINVPSGTMVLAFGSGTWRWQDISGPKSAAADVYFWRGASAEARPPLLNQA